MHNNRFNPLPYLAGGYEFFYEYDQSGRNRADYVRAARDTRFRMHEKFTRTLESDSKKYRLYVNPSG